LTQVSRRVVEGAGRAAFDACFGRDREPSRVLLQERADHLFGEAVAIDVSYIQVIDAELKSARQGTVTLSLIGSTVDSPEAHAAKSNGSYQRPSGAQSTFLHVQRSQSSLNRDQYLMMDAN
jgi:hypothetical protein